MRLTAPGIGGECGCTLGQNRLLYQGLFLAPHTVAQAVKTAVFAAGVMELLGYETEPASSSVRHDIIQMIHMREPEALKKVLQGHPVRRAGGLLCDAGALGHAGLRLPGHHGRGGLRPGGLHRAVRRRPHAPPYTVYLQGGLTFESGRLGVLLAVQELLGGKD